MYRKTAIATAFVLTLMLFAGALAPPTGIAADKAKPGAEAKEKAQKDMGKEVTLEGQVVNLQMFLMREPTPAYAEGKDKPVKERIFGTLAEEVPIGLWVKEKSTVNKLLPGRPVYLIFFDPQVEAQNDAYARAREYVGTHVKITGKTYEREGLTGLAITQIEQLKGEAE